MIDGDGSETWSSLTTRTVSMATTDQIWDSSDSNRGLNEGGVV